jgi:hypothetical protein
MSLYSYNEYFYEKNMQHGWWEPAPWSRALENLIVAQLIEKFSAFYGIIYFIITLTISATE